MMDRLHLMTVFVTVAEEEGFAGAARRLGMSPPAVTRAIAALEDHLGVKLFSRTTRFVRVSEAGQRYLDDARRVISYADAADQAAQEVNTEPRGAISVTASVLFGRMYVMSGIIDYMQRYPAVEVSVVFVDRVVNLLEEGIDVAIRIGELPDSSYKALKVGSVRRVLCASPAYLAEHGVPETPDDLSSHKIILARGLNAAAEFRFVGNKRAYTTRVKPRLMVTDTASTIEAAENGLGITSLISYQIGPQLASGALKVILKDYEIKPVPVHILHCEDRYPSAKVRTFIDLMADRLRASNLMG
jgi:DNA-binding transcriptional LysR family regulator